MKNYYAGVPDVGKPKVFLTLPFLKIVHSIISRHILALICGCVGVVKRAGLKIQ